jgi:predicted RNA methylase
MLPLQVRFHQAMLRDEKRLEAYRAAIRTVVRPGDTVLDLGTGSGIMAFFACQAGASRVYAIEPSEIITVARQLACDNGFEDRITFLQSDVRTAELPEKVDVLISELIARDLIGERMEELVSRGRDRFLKPHGRIIPESVALWLAPVEAPEVYESYELPVKEVYGVDFSSARPSVFNRPYPGYWHVRGEDLLAEPARAHEISTAACKKFRELEALVEFRTTRAGTMHGFTGWFTAELTDGITLSGAPPDLRSWSHAFWPLLQPVPVEQGMFVHLNLSSFHPPRTEAHWSWSTESGERLMRATQTAEFAQDTFSGLWLALEAIRRNAPEQRPRLTDLGRIEHFILGSLDGNNTIGEIARKVIDEHPNTVGDVEEARQLVRRTIARHKIDAHVL